MQPKRDDQAISRLNHPLGALVARVVAAGCSFAVGVVVARVLSLDQFGVFTVLLGVMNVGVVVSLLGHETGATRRVATGLREGAGGLARYCRTASLHVVFTGIVVSVGLMTVLWFWNSRSNQHGAWLLLLIAIPIIARVRLSQAMLRGAHLASLAIAPDGIFRPALTVIGVVSLAAIAAGDRVPAVVFSVLFGGAAALVIAIAWEKRNVTDSLKADRGKLKVAHPREAVFSWPIFASSVLAVADSQLAIIAIGQLSGASQAALYGAADRYAQAAALVGQAVYLAIASRIAALYATNSIDELRKAVRGTVRRVAVTTIVLCVVMALVSTELLRLFGSAYVEANPVLHVLLVAVTLNAVAGPAGVMLLMMKRERAHLAALSGSICVQAVALILLAPEYGATGAAFAVVASRGIWNIGMLAYLRREFGIGPVLAYA